MYITIYDVWTVLRHRRLSERTMARRRNATYFFTFHTISDGNTACKEICCNERASIERGHFVMDYMAERSRAERSRTEPSDT